jgi:hypothetical protein
MTENYISDASLRGESLGRVKDLLGFNRFHREPDDHTPATKRFVQLAGCREVAERGELLFTAIRKGFRYKRKEILLVCDEGGASIKTPDFDVTITLEQDHTDAGGYRLVTEVGSFRREDMVTQDHFVALFAPYCQAVIIRFAQPMDLESRIDQIEEKGDLAEFLDYDSSCSWFSLRLPQLVVEVSARQMLCRLPPGQGDLGRLIAQTDSALKRLAGMGVA